LMPVSNGEKILFDPECIIVPVHISKVEGEQPSHSPAEATQSVAVVPGGEEPRPVMPVGETSSPASAETVEPPKNLVLSAPDVKLETSLPSVTVLVPTKSLDTVPLNSLGKPLINETGESQAKFLQDMVRLQLAPLLKEVRLLSQRVNSMRSLDPAPKKEEKSSEERKSCIDLPVGNKPQTGVPESQSERKSSLTPSADLVPGTVKSAEPLVKPLTPTESKQLSTESNSASKKSRKARRRRKAASNSSSSESQPPSQK
jgi:hypothetical protein